MRAATLDRLLASHRSAADEFLAAAERVAPARWNTPRGAGKWTPGQEVTHVMLVCAAFTRDLRSEAQMRLVGTPLKRLFWGKRITHPYFGTLSLRQSISVSEVHFQHHAAFLGQSAAPAAPVANATPVAIRS